MKTIVNAVLCAALFCAVAFSQAAPFPDQAIYAGGSFDQASSPQSSGFVGYAKLIDKSGGLYSYTRIVETSVSLKPKLAVQTQTETGLCVFTKQFGAFDVFTCATGGLAAAGDAKGFSGSGTVLVTKQIGRGWFAGLAGGPSYSGAISKVTYPVGIVIGWGK